MPRYILAEFNTHRMLSRNSASSRAIPFEKNLESIEKNPFIPIAWMKDHKGMQGTQYFDKDDKEFYHDNPQNHFPSLHVLKVNWLQAKDNAIKQAKILAEIGLTKQIVNRLLEPFMWHTVIVTATEWENFFALRCPQYVRVHGKGETDYRSRKEFSNAETDNGAMMAQHRSEIDWLKLNKGQADIHMMATAEAMWDAMNESTPKELKEGEWHIPFGDNINHKEVESVTGYLMDGSEASEEEFYERCAENKIKIAVARCARVSYTVVGGEGKESNYSDDIKLADRLASSGHWSPFEHVGKCMSEEEQDAWSSTFPNYIASSVEKDLLDGQDAYLGVCGNFKGFVQYRKMFDN